MAAWTCAVCSVRQAVSAGADGAARIPVPLTVLQAPCSARGALPLVAGTLDSAEAGPRSQSAREVTCLAPTALSPRGPRGECERPAPVPGAGRHVEVERLVRSSQVGQAEAEM